MKRSLLITLQEKVAAASKTPWGCFETAGPDDEGRLEFSISYNKAFIENLHKQGYQGINDEETVQMFFISTRMLPESMMEDIDTINPAATPNLTSEANKFVR